MIFYKIPCCNYTDRNTAEIAEQQHDVSKDLNQYVENGSFCQ